jgi:hypothetical protein
MAFVVADRVQETTQSTGTGTITLGGAQPGFQTFSAAIGNGNVTYYTITDNVNWEVGQGTYTQSGNTLSRDVVFASSNSGSLIPVTSGSFVWCDYPASKSVVTDPSYNTNIPFGPTNTNANIGNIALALSMIGR